MKNMLLIIKNTFKVTFRKKGNFIVYLILPLAGVLLATIMYGGTGSSTLYVGICDKDGGSISADFQKNLGELKGYKLSSVVESDIGSKLLDKKLDAVIIIPKGYSDGIYKNNPQKIRLVSIKGEESNVWLKQYINIYTRNLSDLSAASGGDRSTFDRMYADYLANQLKITEVKLEDTKKSMMMTMTSLGFLIMFVMLGANLTSMFILDDKRNRTYYRICSAPVNSWQYIASNAVSSLGIVAMQIIVIIIVLKYLFHIQTYVPDLMLFLVLLLFGVVAIGICLLVVSFSSSSYMSSTLNTLIVVPTCMLGGCYWSVEYMPETMRKLSYFTPQRWVLEAVQKLQTGSGLEGVAMNLVILVAFAAALILAAVYRFAKTGSVEKFV